MEFFLLGQPQLACYANDNDSMVPELWAMEALAVLESNMVMANLVHRDYSSLVANFGDVVNARRPVDFRARRKTDSDNVVVQDAQAPNIRVPLDQHLHVTFVIKDGEMSKAFSDLVGVYLGPAAKELAEKVDQVLAGQSARLSTYTAGRLNEMSKTNASDFILEADRVLNQNRAPRTGRSLVLSPVANAHALGADLFVSAEKRGDGGTALREASLGRVYNFDAYMDQNVTYVDPSDTETSSGVTTAAYAAGEAGAIDTDVTFADVTVGCYVVFEGDGEAYRVSAVTDDSGDADITVVGGLQHAVASGADVTVYMAADVDAAAQSGTTYAAGYAKEIIIDGHASGKNLQAGQWITFGTGGSSHSYSVVWAEATSATSSTVLLDRPLDASLANNSVAFPGPAGSMNLAFTRDAIALVNRPLETVPAGHGARSFVASYNGISLRVTMQYDWQQQGTVVTLDLLCGVAILDARQAVVLYS